jgi:hypothetical protein
MSHKKSTERKLMTELTKDDDDDDDDDDDKAQKYGKLYDELSLSALKINTKRLKQCV